MAKESPKWTNNTKPLHICQGTNIDKDQERRNPHGARKKEEEEGRKRKKKREEEALPAQRPVRPGPDRAAWRRGRSDRAQTGSWRRGRSDRATDRTEIFDISGYSTRSTGPTTGPAGPRPGERKTCPAKSGRPGANRASDRTAWRQGRSTGRQPGQSLVNRAVDRAGRSRAWSTGRQPGATSTTTSANHRHPLHRRQPPPPSPNHRQTSPRPHNLRRNRKGIDTTHHRLTTATTAKLL
ncbi:hypothetical protein QYE76_003891 [Lolium multiflorum]|uniref:Uncharacterized protein n=1 Tax=Lolium multiflorum TaxID=4521 RepID=A0AAD8RTF0_LOLMU|nr:hypothetical protein QYE76_003891 [Lolium multiflorum]